MKEYISDAWETKKLVELYEKVGWCENRMNFINWVLDINPTNLLEVACLDGCYIRKLRDLGFTGKYTGIDITKKHINLAVERTYPPEDFRIGDARNLDFEDDEFEMVTVSDVIQHLPDPIPPLINACRVAFNYVFVSIYGAKDHTYTYYRKRSLNTRWIKEDFDKFIPSGWNIVNFKIFLHPTIANQPPSKKLLFHYMLKKDKM